MNSELMVLCMQKNEGELLNAWIKYHVTLLGHKSLLLIDNGSTDNRTLEIISNAKESGIEVISAPLPTDFEDKGKIISRLIRENSKKFKWFAPLDCDEFLCIFDTDIEFTVSFEKIQSELTRLNSLGAKIARISRSLWNVPGTTLAYPLRIKQVLIACDSGVELDLGFHLYSWDKNRDTLDSNLFFDTNIGHLHFHNKPYLNLISSSREKLKLRVPNFHPKTLNSYTGAGKHLVKYFNMTHESYVASLPKGVVDLQNFSFLFGEDIPFKKFEEFIQKSDIEFLLSVVNPYFYTNRIVASPNEIIRLSKLLSVTTTFLEFGAGGTTALACESGVQKIISVETDIDFCISTLDKFGLQKYVDTGRLQMQHVDIGPTKEWGYPITKPSPRRVENYLGMARYASESDLIFLDGRYRVAVAANVYQFIKADSSLVVHDYSPKRGYKVLEQIFNLVELVDELAIFKPIPSKHQIAHEIRDAYFDDPS